MKSLIVACVAVALLGACQTLPKPDRIGAHLNPDPLSLPQNHQTYVGAAGNQALAYVLINASNIRCENYLVGVSAGRNTADAGLSIGAQAFSAIGSLAVPGASANAWSGASTFLQGANRTLQTSVFAGQNFHVVYEAVHRGREREAALLRADIDTKKWDALPHEGILERVTPYDLKCGINYGMVEISRALGRTDESKDDDTP